MVIKKILVTGGAGFVGSHLCEELSKNPGNEVYSLDNYHTGRTENHVKGVNYIRGDTSEISNFINFCPDRVYHLGEYSRVEQSFEDSELVFKFNLTGTNAVLEFCRRNNCKIIYAGSSTKFGDDGEGPNQSPYGWSKSINTELIVNYGNWFGLNYAITYFYNAYGPRELSEGKYATVIGIFSKQMEQGKPITVVSPGIQRRNFTHVKDIVSGLITVGDFGEGDNFGIGSDDQYSILEVAEMFSEKIQFLPERKGNRKNASVKTEKTKNLGWSPKVCLEDYILNYKKSIEGSTKC